MSDREGELIGDMSFCVFDRSLFELCSICKVSLNARPLLHKTDFERSH